MPVFNWRSPIGRGLTSVYVHGPLHQCVCELPTARASVKISEKGSLPYPLTVDSFTPTGQSARSIRCKNGEDTFHLADGLTQSANHTSRPAASFTGRLPNRVARRTSRADRLQSHIPAKLHHAGDCFCRWICLRAVSFAVAKNNALEADRALCQWLQQRNGQNLGLH